jgi:hypothetical protein
MRRLSMADVDGLLDLYSDPEVRRYIHVPDGYGANTRLLASRRTPASGTTSDTASWL